MTFSQRMIWTAIPNGMTAGGDLRLTAYVSPRLQSTSAAIADLSNWPDWVDWPATLAAIDIFAVIGASTQATSPDPDSDAPDSAVWTKLFPSDSPVRPYDFAKGFKGLDNRRIRSIPLAPILDFIQDNYTDIAVASPTELPAVTDLLQRFDGLTFQSKRTEDLAIEQIENQLDDAKALGALGTNQLNFLQAKMFHKVYWNKVPHNLLKPTVELVDFHQAVGQMNGFQRLLRMLGLAIDLIVPVPAGASSPTNVHFLLRSPPGGTIETPDTSAILAPPQHRFEPQPRAGNAADVALGLLRLGDPEYHLVEVDPDGAALRVRRFADNLHSAHLTQRHAPDTPDREGLPALRSGGFGVFRSDNAIRQHGLFQATKALNTALGTPSAVPFRAEDLLQGLRWDVFDVAAGEWFSLMERVGDYVIGGSSPLTPTIDDEGVASTSVVQDPNAAANDATTDLFLGEVLARFTGDSMAAPRPGKTLDTDPAGDPIDSQQIDDPNFHLTETFTPVPGSLPPLRFGQLYRMRARATYVGGTGLGPDDPNPADFTHATDEAVYGRFEPVPPPGVVPRSAKTEGEHIERLVIRSNYNVPSGGPNTRWIVAPKVAQLVAEQHGMFDLANAMDGTLATYQMIVARESGSFLRPVLPDPETGAEPDPNAFDQPYYPVANLHFPVENGGTAKLPYLPDPMSHGAAFRGLPGAGGALAFVLWGNDPWPASDPFVMRIQEGNGAPALNGRVMTVQLPKATVAEVRMSSSLLVADLEKMGIWQWILERNPANLSTLRGLAARGQLWMISPFRTLTLVHAVRQPLVPPLFSPSAAANKAAIGDTFATLVDKISFSRKSTVQLDVIGEWTDPIDASAAEPRQMVAHHDHAALVKVPSAGNDAFFVLQAKHDYHDTKFHRTKYTLVAKTRFAEYFVQHVSVHLTGQTPAVVDPAGLVEDSDVVTDPTTGHRYVRGTDYVVDLDAGTIARKAGTSIPNDGDVSVQFLARPITRDSDEHPAPPTPKLIVKNSRRPDPPKVEYAVPLFGWERQQGASGVASKRVGNGLRIFLSRPWWSSGDEERLGVVFSDRPTTPMKQWITQWGFDPVYGAVHPGFKITNDLFPLATVFGAGLQMAEIAAPGVSVAGHDVDFDSEKKMWFADVKMELPPYYWPFVRMGLVRFQPHSIAGAHLSRVVLADFVRLAPDRTATIVKSSDFEVRITVVGMSYTAVKSVPGIDGPLTMLGPGQMTVAAQLRDPAVPDPTLGWKVQQGPVTMGHATLGDGQTRWTAAMKFPFAIGTKPLRLVFVEREDFGSGRKRTVYLDTVPLT